MPLFSKLRWLYTFLGPINPLLSLPCAVLVLVLAGDLARAQDATWLSAPVSGDFNTGANWSPAVVPTGTAFFSTSNITALSNSAPTTIGGFTFNPGASSYTFGTNGNLTFNGAGIVTNGGSFVLTNNNNFDLEFLNNSSAGGALINNFDNIFFRNSSAAGTATINNGGFITLSDSSSLSNAFVTNNDLILFWGNSTAGNATIINNNAIQFSFNSSAGNSTITTTNGATTEFLINSSPAQARLITQAGGTVDMSNSLSVALVAGSIEGDGTYSLGAFKTLSVGNVSPGMPGAIGTLSITGTSNFAFSAGGTFAVQVDALGNSDRISLQGSLNLTGAILQVMEQPGTYVNNVGDSIDYVIIDNDGADAVVGTFASITNTLAFLTPTVNTAGGDGNDVVLTLTRNSLGFVDVASTPNQLAVAAALQNGFITNANADSIAVTGALLGLSVEGARNAFDQMSGEAHASAAHVLLASSRQLTNFASDRLWDVLFQKGVGTGVSERGQDLAYMGLGLSSNELYGRMSLGVSASGYGGGVGAVSPNSRTFGSWVRGFGVFLQVENDGNGAKTNSRTGGVLVGGDALLSPGIRLGVMGGWGSSDIDVDERASTADVDSGHIATYASLTAGEFIFKALAGYTKHDLETNRRISFGSLSRAAVASYGADQTTLYGEAAYRMRAGGFSILPTIGVRWAYLDVDGFREGGAGTLNLSSNGETYKTFDTVMGVRFATTVMMGDVTLIPQANIGWTHSFGDVDPSLNLAFQGGGAFTIAGPARARDVVSLGGGLNIIWSDVISGYADYSAELSNDLRDQSISGGLRIRF